MKYPLGFNTWDNKEITLITKVLKSGNFVMGKKVKIFEKKFAKYFQSKHAIMVNSGSSANLLMLSLIKYFPEFLKKKKNKKSQYNCTSRRVEHLLLSDFTMWF